MVRLRIRGIPTAVPDNNHGSKFNAIALVISGYWTVQGHKISKQEKRHTGEYCHGWHVVEQCKSPYEKSRDLNLII